MVKRIKGLGVINNILIIAATIIVSAFSFVYKKLIQRPLNSIVEKIIIPLLETLDSEYGVLVFFLFLVEVFISLIIPWFFNWIIGVIIVCYLLLTISFIIYLIKNDTPTDNWKMTILMFWIIPYLTMAFFPTSIVTIFRKKEKPKPTLTQIRRTKLKYLKKKIRYNRLKIWKKWIG